MPKLTVRFSGVVAFVPHSDGTRYRLLFPDSPMGRHQNDTFVPGTVRNSLDGHPLRRHHPHIRTGSTLSGIRMIEDEEIRFQFGSEGETVDASGLRVIPMGQVVKAARCVLDADAIERPLASPLVCGFLDIDRGALSTGPTQAWRIEGALNDSNDWQDTVAQNVFWTVETDQKVEVRAVAASGASTSLVTLDTDVRDRTLTVCNFMPGDITRYLTGGGGSLSQPDEDFKWYYELFAGDPGDPATPKGWIVQTLNGADLPIPREPSATASPADALSGIGVMSPGGQNCLPAVFSATSW